MIENQENTTWREMTDSTNEKDLTLAEIMEAIDFDNIPVFPDFSIDSYKEESSLVSQFLPNDHKIVFHCVGGRCPFQAWGEIGDRKFYYREENGEANIKIQNDLELDDYSQHTYIGSSPLLLTSGKEDHIRTMLSCLSNLKRLPNLYMVPFKKIDVNIDMDARGSQYSFDPLSVKIHDGSKEREKYCYDGYRNYLNRDKNDHYVIKADSVDDVKSILTSRNNPLYDTLSFIFEGSSGRYWSDEERDHVLSVCIDAFDTDNVITVHDMSSIDKLKIDVDMGDIIS